MNYPHSVNLLLLTNKMPTVLSSRIRARVQLVLSLPSPASFQLVEPRGKISPCKELFWHVYNRPKIWVVKETFSVFSSPQVFLWFLTTCAHRGAMSCKTSGTVENPVFITLSRLLLLSLTLNHPDLHFAGETSLPHATKGRNCCLEMFWPCPAHSSCHDWVAFHCKSSRAHGLRDDKPKLQKLHSRSIYIFSSENLELLSSRVNSRLLGMLCLWLTFPWVGMEHFRVLYLHQHSTNAQQGFWQIWVVLGMDKQWR